MLHAILECPKECRYGIPFSGRKHLWGLYRVVTMHLVRFHLVGSELSE